MSKNNKKRIRAKREAAATPAQARDEFGPVDVSGLDVAFGPNDIGRYLPSREKIPERYWRCNDPAAQLVSELFFRGGHLPAAKPGVDGAKAARHLKAILVSFTPKHEHKIAGAAFLLDRWFVVKAA